MTLYTLLLTSIFGFFAGLYKASNEEKAPRAALWTLLGASNFILLMMMILKIVIPDFFSPK